MDREIAEGYLKRAVGDPDAKFRSGQWEAVNGLINSRQKLLVIQRTGWGKSSVYFISAKMLRDRGAGPTIIVSPLLALMRNQIVAAERLGISAATINSSNTEDWDEVTERVRSNKVDVLLISPERLSNEAFVSRVMLPLSEKLGLLVVDEAHCISDWGHDFRPDYRRIVGILQQVPRNMPILGTTATANDRVIEDICSQLGDVQVHRGTLVRESLVLQTIELDDQASRLAWLSKAIPDLPGAGIIYVLTKRDAEQVSHWLRLEGLDVHAYYAGVSSPDYENSAAYRQYLEDCLLRNSIKALVSTTALGMGYDKPDLGFVVHYQAPSSVISYYQQVGRAGRSIDTAYAVLLAGREDSEIHEFFRRSAFPTEAEVSKILRVLEEHDGLSIQRIQAFLNVRPSRVERALKVLSVESPSPVLKAGGRWYRTPVAFELDIDKIGRLTRQREDEWEQIQRYISTEGCLMSFLRSALDDPIVTDCGRCMHCVSQLPVSDSIRRDKVIEASRFLRQSEITIKPRVRVDSGAFPQYGFRGNLPRNLQAEEGRVLSRWGDAGWGHLVSEGKHTGSFCDELVEAMAEMIEVRWKPSPAPSWITCVPSRAHPSLVPGFAERLATRLSIPFHAIVRKIADNEPQKLQENRFFLCRNLDGVFKVDASALSGPVFLLDDIVDSRWTMTVISALLRQAGSGLVFPIALASTSTGD